MRAFDADRKTYAPERLLAFSDAVMAVAITLLVLDLKLPEGVSDADLGAVLRGSLHGVGVYALSFVVIGLFWMGITSSSPTFAASTGRSCGSICSS